MMVFASAMPSSWSLAALALTTIATAALVSAHPAQQTQNVTLQLPVGSVSYPDTHTICTPAAPTDIILFFLTNFVAHAVTVRSLPGEGPASTAVKACVALLCPSFGFVRAIDALLRAGRFGRSPLERAARSGALCMLVRDQATWRPRPGDRIRDVVCLAALADARNRVTANEPKSRVPTVNNNVPWLDDLTKLWVLTRGPERFPSPSAVFGTHRLPEGYKFMIVPHHTYVHSVHNAKDGDGNNKVDDQMLISSYSWAKPVIAIVQIVFAAITLYQSRGGQLEQFGYAAYSFSVIPYLFMSLTNFLAMIATPDYPCFYKVRSDVMAEAEGRGGYFETIVGGLECSDEPSQLALGEATWLAVEDPGGSQHRVSLVRNEVKHAAAAGNKALAVAMVSEEQEEEGEGSAESTGPATTECPVAVDQDTAAADVLPRIEHVDLAASFAEPPPSIHGWNDHPVQDYLIVPGASRYKRRNHLSTLMLDDEKKIMRNPDGSYWQWWMAIFVLVRGMVVPGVSMVVIGAISHFRPGRSSIAQRVWLFLWLCLTNYASNPADRWASSLAHPQSVWEAVRSSIVPAMVLVTPGIGMFVVVGQQLTASGTCTNLEGLG